MSDSMVVRRYREDDRGSVVRLLQEVYPWVSSPEAFSWRFELNPAGTPILVVAEDETGIIGLNSWMPWPVTLGGRDLRAWQSGESAVHPNARGRGVFGKLLREGAAIGAAEGGDLFFGFPNQASIGSFLRAEWKLLHTLRWWVRPAPLALMGVPFPWRGPARIDPVAEPAFQFGRSEQFVRWRIGLNPYHRYDSHEVAGGQVISRLRMRRGFAERMLIAGLDQSGALLNPRDSAAYLARSGARAAFVSFAATAELGGPRTRLPLFHRVPGKGVYFIVLRLNPAIEEAAIYSSDGWEPSSFEVDIL